MAGTSPAITIYNKFNSLISYSAQGQD